jgi:hypothetical protein
MMELCCGNKYVDKYLLKFKLFHVCIINSTLLYGKTNRNTKFSFSFTY